MDGECIPCSFLMLLLTPAKNDIPHSPLFFLLLSSRSAAAVAAVLPL
jgi:hypothetical protein